MKPDRIINSLFRNLGRGGLFGMKGPGTGAGNSPARMDDGTPQKGGAKPAPGGRQAQKRMRDTRRLLRQIQRMGRMMR